MPGILETEGAQAPPPQQESSSEAHYAVTQQEVDLEVDFRSRSLKGRATIIIEPSSKALKSVSLGCRAIKVTKITVDKYPVKVPAYRDPYCGLSVRVGYGVHQHHQMRDNVDDAVQDQPDPNLTIAFPPQVKIKELKASDVNVQAAGKDGTVEAALVNTMEEGEALFDPVTIVVDYEVENSRDSLQWIGLQSGDSRYPHVYTCASSLPGSLPCFVFPILGAPTSKCSWKLSICCPRTLGDLGRKLNSELHGNTLTNGVDGHEAEAMDVDEPENEFLRKLTSEEKNRDIMIIGSGLVEDNDAPCKDTEHMRKWILQCSVPVAPVNIGFAIGPFEEVDFSEFRESGKEDQLKDHAVGVRGYCLPGRAEELRNTCLPLQMAVDSFMQSYISYPFAPECQTYKMCFVDDLPQDVIDTASTLR